MERRTDLLIPLRNLFSTGDLMAKAMMSTYDSVPEDLEQLAAIWDNAKDCLRGALLGHIAAEIEGVPYLGSVKLKNVPVGRIKQKN